MYSYIEGTVQDKDTNLLVLDCGGVGYEIICTNTALSAAPPKGETMRVYTYLNVRQDAIELLGFVSKEEKNMFLKLTGVSGIGARSAISILSSMPLKDLTMAILSGDLGMLSRAPGVGKKTAQRIALELKDKVSAVDMPGDIDFADFNDNDTSPSSPVGEAILALESLGYTQHEAARAVSNAQKAGVPMDKADELVRAALRGIAKG
ncbi:MAG: Holliday junction branch migration protein RuvA [Eubacteriales bacterium]|nr:Holliday junction branch migration protein RuvA [Eubacteriales bacterium]